MKNFILVFSPDGYRRYWEVQAKTKQEALKFVDHATQQQPVAIYREITDGNAKPQGQPDKERAKDGR